jgi:hypothetical protein
VTFWELVWGSMGGRLSVPEIILMVVVLAVVCGIVGSITGLIIGGADVGPDVGAWIGVGAGLLLGLAEMALAGNARAAINLIFWFFTGRYIGASIAARVQQPVLT